MPILLIIYIRNIYIKLGVGGEAWVLLLKGEATPVHCNALGVGLPADIPVNLSIEAGREEVHYVRTALSIGTLEHG